MTRTLRVWTAAAMAAALAGCTVYGEPYPSVVGGGYYVATPRPVVVAPRYEVYQPYYYSRRPASPRIVVTPPRHGYVPYHDHHWDDRRDGNGWSHDRARPDTWRDDRRDDDRRDHDRRPDADRQPWHPRAGDRPPARDANRDAQREREQRAAGNTGRPHPRAGVAPRERSADRAGRRTAAPGQVSGTPADRSRTTPSRMTPPARHRGEPDRAEPPRNRSSKARRSEPRRSTIKTRTR